MLHGDAATYIHWLLVNKYLTNGQWIFSRFFQALKRSQVAHIRVGEWEVGWGGVGEWEVGWGGVGGGGGVEWGDWRGWTVGSGTYQINQGQL